MAAAAAPELFPFVFFGCWNQPGLEGTTPPRNKVAEVIAEMPDIKYIVLGGDNVYPKPIPGVKNKKHEESVFMEGMELYTRLGKPIITAFGNHNVELLDKQKEVFGVVNTYNRYDFADNIHIIVLDTNIIIDDPAKPEYGAMLEWFRTQVSELAEGHKYYIVQHEPYFTARAKAIGELANADPFLDILFMYPPIAILCADTHHYQYATIKSIAYPDVTLHQFIVGTGGANFDKHRPGFVYETLREKYIFSQINVVEGFGFLRINGPDPAAFDFVHVSNWNGWNGGGRRFGKGKRKSLRRKYRLRSRYLTLSKRSKSRNI